MIKRQVDVETTRGGGGAGKVPQKRGGNLTKPRTPLYHVKSELHR